MKKKSIGKRGQKLARRFTKFSKKVSSESADHIKENLVSRFSHVQYVRVLVLEWSLLVALIIFLGITQAFWYSESYATTTYARGGTYTEATLGQINSLNPLFASTNSEQSLSKLMFATLTATDFSGHTGVSLAKSISMDKSGKVWTMELKDNLKWSDGEPLTNEDVIFTVDLIKDPKTNTSYTANFSDVTVKQNEKGQIIFKLPAPNVYFATSLNIPVVPKHILGEVAPEKVLEHTFSTAPVTSGAFSYNATQTVGNDGEKIVYLSPNSNYFKGTAMLDSFAVHAYTTTDNIVSALNSGTVSATAELTSADSSRITSSSIAMRQTSLSYGVYAFLNTDSDLLKNASFRRSLRQGINLTNLRSTLNGEQPLDYPLTESQINSKNLPELPSEDYIKAKRDIDNVLASAKSKELRVVTINSGHLPEIAENLVKQLKDLGFSATSEVFEPNQDFTLNVLRPRAYDILVYKIGLGPDPDVMAYYHSSQASSTGYNLSNYRSAIVNDLLASARGTSNADLRAKKYENFLSRWVQDVPAIGIYQSSLTYYVNKNVRTFSSENSLVYATDRFNDVSYWASEKVTKNRTP